MDENEKRMTAVRSMRDAIFYLSEAKNCYLDNLMHIEAIEVGSIIQKRQNQLEEFLATNFPIIERKSNEKSKSI